MSGGLVYGEGFAVVPEAVLYAPGVSSVAKLLWAVFARHADQDGRSYPGRKRLAELLAVSEDTIKRAKKELVEAGLIAVKERFDDAGRRTTDDVFLHHARRTSAPGGRGTSAPTGSRPSSNEIKALDAAGAKTGRDDPRPLISDVVCFNCGNDVPECLCHWQEARHAN